MDPNGHWNEEMIKENLPGVNRLISLTCREGNKVAHCIAKWAANHSFDLIWIEDVPPWLEEIVQAIVLVLVEF